MASARQMDWTSAEVHERTLSVRITGDAPKGYSQRVERCWRCSRPRIVPGARRRVTRESITVDDVEPGMESEDGHFLESVLSGGQQRVWR